LVKPFFKNLLILGAVHIVLNSAGVIHGGMFISKSGKTIATKDLNRVMMINVTGN